MNVLSVLKSRRFFAIVALLGVFAGMLLFQNCSQVGFNADPAGFFKSNNNGGGYGGKPDGDFYRFVPGFTCEDKESPMMHIAITATSIALTENKKLACGAVKQDLDPAQIDTSIYQGDVIGYQDGIFEGKDETPSSIPANLVEIWCRDDHTYNGIETITHYDHVSGVAVNRTYYATPNGDGSYQKKIVADFPVARVIDDKTVTVKDEFGFELVVHRDQPAVEAGLYVGHMNAVIEGQRVSRDTSCRLGGLLDADIWPAKRVVDVNVLQMRTSPDQTSFSFTSDTGTGNTARAYLYVSNMLGTIQKRISSALNADAGSFGFTPDSKKLMYVSSFDAAPGMIGVNLDGTSEVIFDRVESPSSFTFSTDGRYLIYSKYDPAYRLPSIGLRSTLLTGGPIYTLNPPLSLGAMNVASFSAYKDKAIFFCCNGPATQIYVANVDGSGVKTLPRDLPAGWDYVPRWLAAPGDGALLSVWAWDQYGKAETANYIIAFDGSGSVKLPSGWLWTGTSPSKEWLLLRDLKDLTSAQAVNVATKQVIPIPKLLPETADPVRDGTESVESRFFARDSLSYVMLRQGLSAGARNAIAVSLVDGSITELCPGVNTAFVKETAAGEFLLAGLDSGLLKIYRKMGTQACRVVNSVPTKLKSLDQIRIALNGDLTMILATVTGPAMAAQAGTLAQLFYIPMNGRASYQINTPVVNAAGVKDAFFVKDSKTVLFVGDQIRLNENSVFRWTAP